MKPFYRIAIAFAMLAALALGLCLNHLMYLLNVWIHNR